MRAGIDVAAIPGVRALENWFASCFGSCTVPEKGELFRPFLLVSPACAQKYNRRRPSGYVSVHPCVSFIARDRSIKVNFIGRLRAMKMACGRTSRRAASDGILSKNSPNLYCNYSKIKSRQESNRHGFREQQALATAEQFLKNQMSVTVKV